jgi:hypothetical protein
MSSNNDRLVRLNVPVLGSHFPFFFSVLCSGLSLFPSKPTSRFTPSVLFNPFSTVLSPFWFVVSSSRISKSSLFALPA